MSTFIENAKEAFNDLKELKIVTLVGKAKMVNGQVTFGYEDQAEVEAMVSRIGLFDGDVKTEMTEKFVNEYDQLREFHMLKERQGFDIIKRNVEVVEKIGNMVFDFIKRETAND